MIHLRAFTKSDFIPLIKWIDDEDSLINISGYEFSFPLTEEQLITYIRKKNSYAFTVVLSKSDKEIGHAELVLADDETYKIDKLLIGEKSLRGKGIGQAITHELLQFAFGRLNSSTVELNIFDRNIAGINCFEKCGFTAHPKNDKLYSIGNKNWTFLNMRISKFNWLLMQS